MPHLTDASVKRIPSPDTGNRISYDDAVKGFGVRVTAAGARAFILNYRTRSGRERRYTNRADTTAVAPTHGTARAQIRSAGFQRTGAAGQPTPLADPAAGRVTPAAFDPPAWRLA